MPDAASNPRVLLVDDDANLLAGLRRKLRKGYELVTAEGPDAALEILQSDEVKARPFAVVVADMQMPGMTGVQLLERIAPDHPDTVRVMLTGNADQATAVHAVNRGSVFRFLTKPCDTETLTATLDAAIAQHRLIVAEKQLLQQTLRGSVKLLVDLLAVVDPEAHARAMSLKSRMAKLVGPLDVPRPWEAEIAALVSPLGFMAIPEALREKLDRPSRMSPAEKKQVTAARAQVAALVANIPRLEGVAEILEYQSARFDGGEASGPTKRRDSLPLASRILHALNDIAELEASGLSVPAAVDMLGKVLGKHDPDVLKAIEREVTPPEQRVPTPVPIRDLIIGQELAADVVTHDGRLLMRKNAELTEAGRTALLNFLQAEQIEDTVTVYINATLADAA
ncbi:MAG: HD domain-containing phosphohydrolase [Planctomycetota bacterium]